MDRIIILSPALVAYLAMFSLRQLLQYTQAPAQAIIQSKSSPMSRWSPCTQTVPQCCAPAWGGQTSWQSSRCSWTCFDFVMLQLRGRLIQAAGRCASPQQAVSGPLETFIQSETVVVSFSVRVRKARLLRPDMLRS
ncbi:hypothetical protein T440DRAFT_104566 [Plenodomus tracheiphilus IPT5]|uniref:Uncharacterized protein n=1 Tax=Plenodomus tracheiphilus IPT5 TaxID=1408161 RepID=A0A6A7BLI7_9PLEO|nr:hypothetical protein T440DRAFT_104566 [Plenodomus tracheiphilus IPT5]